MPIATASRTPYYVLLDGNRPVGPKVVPTQSDAECATIFGFSDKQTYSTFRANSESPLTPYPLVKGYLRNKIDEPGDDLRLVIVDVDSPSELYVRAATMQEVLDSQERRAANVAATYGLTFDPAENAYRVDEASA